MNKSLSETSENFVTNQILDKLNCHTLQNINKIYPQFSRELEKLKQNDCCEHISIADKLGQPGNFIFFFSQFIPINEFLSLFKAILTSKYFD